MNHRGNTFVLKHASGIEWDEDYNATGKARWWCYPYTDADNRAPAIGSAHPKHSILHAVGVKITEGDGGAFIDVSYEGVAGPQNGPAYTVSAQPVVREAPITTHPKFGEWAGTQANPKEAVFDLSGRFVEWLPSSDLSGQEAWLMPTLSVVVTTKDGGEPDVPGFLGKIHEGAQGLPNVGSRTWLGVGIPYRGPTAAGEFTVDREYLMSGPDGWNERVYGGSS